MKLIYNGPLKKIYGCGHVLKKGIEKEVGDACESLLAQGAEKVEKVKVKKKIEAEKKTAPVEKKTFRYASGK